MSVPGFFRLPLSNPGAAAPQSPPIGVQQQPAGPPGNVFTLGPPGGNFRQGPVGPQRTTYHQVPTDKVSEHPVNLRGDPDRQHYRQRNMVKKV